MKGTPLYWLLTITCLWLGLYAQSPEVRIWEGKAPGSENWSQPETVTESRGGRIISNVSGPTFTPCVADPAAATGAAVIVCPGGAFLVLAWDEEGAKAAEWLNSKGVAGEIHSSRISPMA